MKNYRGLQLTRTYFSLLTRRISWKRKFFWGEEGTEGRGENYEFFSGYTPLGHPSDNDICSDELTFKMKPIFHCSIELGKTYSKV